MTFNILIPNRCGNVDMNNNPILLMSLEWKHFIFTKENKHMPTPHPSTCTKYMSRKMSLINSYFIARDYFCNEMLFELC